MVVAFLFLHDALSTKRNEQRGQWLKAIARVLVFYPEDRADASHTACRVGGQCEMKYVLGLTLPPEEFDFLLLHAMNLTLEIALLFGSISAGNAMAGGVGIALVDGIYTLNEVLGRPVVRMSAGLVGVILSGIS